jgi:hypothetical protein
MSPLTVALPARSTLSAVRFTVPLVMVALLTLLTVTTRSAHAEFSPLSIHPEGFGMPLAQMGSRERAMGEGGLAAVTNKGFFLPNVSRSAFHDKTVFIASLENDVDWLRDDASSARMTTGAFPTLATLIKSKTFGTFGAYYQQSHLRNFEVRVPRNGDEPAASYLAEGGLYILGVSWAYSPMPWLAIGVSQNLVLGRDRFIQPVDFSGIAPNEAENLSDTSLESSSQGSYPSLSLTMRLPRNMDLALSYTHSTELAVDRRRSTNNQGSDPLPDTIATLPKVLAAGIGWRPDRRQTLVLDVFFEGWADEANLNPARQFSAGYEYRASESPFDGLLKRTAWRAGAGYKTLYLREVPELFATAGFGIPLGPRGHQLDFAVKYGHRSFDGNTFFAEDYVKLSASVVGVSIWGQPVRKRR